MVRPDDSGSSPSPLTRLASDATGRTTSRTNATPLRPAAPAKKAPVRKRVAPTSAARSRTKPAAAPAATSGLVIAARLRALIAAAPGAITITSGRRSRAEQQALYNDYIAGKGNIAAKPGTSLHESGEAADLHFESPEVQKWAHDNAARFGLVFPIAGEAWHVEPVEARGQTLSAAAKQAGLTPIKVSKPQAAGATATQTGGGLGVDAKVDPAAALAAYGSIAELAKTVPDIKRVISQAIAQGIDPTTTAGQQRFQQMLQGTAWWKQTASNQRDNQILKATDPRKWKELRQTYHDKIVILARNLGVPMTDDAAITRLAERAMNLGWSDNDIRRYVAADIKVGSGVVNTGEAAVTVDALKQKAADWLVPISDATLQTWTRQILRGDVPAEAFDSYLKEQAKSMFPGLAAAIDRGVTVRQYTDPYRQYASQILEIDGNNIDFVHDPVFSKALFNTDPKTGERTQMSLADWQTYLRKTPQYSKTAQATEQAAQFATTLAQTFGKVA
jgi:hypothetical protein